VTALRSLGKCCPRLPACLNPAAQHAMMNVLSTAGVWSLADSAGCWHRHMPRAGPARCACQLRQHVTQPLRGGHHLGHPRGKAEQHANGRGLRALAASAAWRPDFSLDPPITREQLRDPAYIHGSASASSPVQVPMTGLHPAGLICGHMRTWQSASKGCQSFICDVVRL
jgi:hypothetical protein